jgi:hypothetical protein
MIVTYRPNGAGPSAFVTERADPEDMHVYLVGHSLIPPDFAWGRPGAAELAEIAIGVLASEDHEPRDLLWALVILGHSPTAAAMRTLERWATGRHPLAGVAEVASLECAQWMIEPGAVAS